MLLIDTQSSALWWWRRWAWKRWLCQALPRFKSLYFYANQQQSVRNRTFLGVKVQATNLTIPIITKSTHIVNKIKKDRKTTTTKKKQKQKTKQKQQRTSTERSFHFIRLFPFHFQSFSKFAFYYSENEHLIFIVSILEERNTILVPPKACCSFF